MGRRLEDSYFGSIGDLWAVEDLLNPTNIPYHLPTNLEKVYKDVVGEKLIREDMTNILTTLDLLG